MHVKGDISTLQIRGHFYFALTYNFVSKKKDEVEDCGRAAHGHNSRLTDWKNTQYA